MSATMIEPVTPPQPHRSHKIRTRLIIGGTIAIALLAGVGIGAAASNNSAALSAANHTVSTQRATIGSLNDRIGALQGDVAAAQDQARQATTTATTKAQADYAARNAALDVRSKALDARSKGLDQRERAIAATEGQLQASQISGDGVYVVGKDIAAGVYHTNGSGNTGQNDCYLAVLNNSTNTSDVNNIAYNDNFDGPNTVDLTSAYAFETNGPCTWVKVG